MASLRVHPDRLEIHLTPAEKTLAFRREDVVIQRENIRSVTITDDPWIWVRGIRAPGALVPLVVAVGVWKFHGGKDFLAIKRRRQAVVIDLIGDDFARVILSTNHAPDLIASLKLEATDAQDVPELDESVAPAAEPEQPAEPTTAVKPVKRTRTPKVVKPVEQTDTAAQLAPVKPAKRVRPAKVVPAAAPAESVGPTASADPVDGADPVDAAVPVGVAVPVDDAVPAAPATPAKRAARAKAAPAAMPADLPAADPADLPEATA